MKYTLIAISALAVLSGCAGTKVTHTDVATGDMNPRAIYIRPFSVGEVKGDHGSEGYRVLRESQAPLQFANILKEELEKIAPCIVLADDEVAPTGWLVEGELQVVDAGSPGGAGSSATPASAAAALSPTSSSRTSTATATPTARAAAEIPFMSSTSPAAAASTAARAASSPPASATRRRSTIATPPKRFTTRSRRTPTAMAPAAR